MFNNKSVWFATANESNMQCNVSDSELCGYFLNDSTIYIYYTVYIYCICEWP